MRRALSRKPRDQRTKAKGLRLFVAGVYGFLFAPIVVLVLFSFNDSKRNATWQGFTLRWYNELFHDGPVLDALFLTLKIAVLATILATIFGALGAYALTRYKFRGSGLYNGAIYVPLVIPEIVFAVALLSGFNAAGIIPSFKTIIIAHVAFMLSFVIVVVRSRMAGFDRTLEEAAMDLGANEIQTFVYVTLPFMMPGILAGSLLAFVLSFDDFVITFFNSGVGNTTLPLKVYSMVKFGVTPEINAISVFMLLVSSLLLLATYKLQGGPPTITVRAPGEE
ncbi:MAG: ABC transporter permease [Thermoleophilia bacterium]|nr:ABC transporter permease [Thermoleophilia bacterium]